MDLWRQFHASLNTCQENTLSGRGRNAGKSTGDGENGGKCTGDGGWDSSVLFLSHGEWGIRTVTDSYYGGWGELCPHQERNKYPTDRVTPREGQVDMGDHGPSRMQDLP